MGVTAQWGLNEKRKHCDKNFNTLRRVLPGVEIGAKEMYRLFNACSFIYLAPRIHATWIRSYLVMWLDYFDLMCYSFYKLKSALRKS